MTELSIPISDSLLHRLERLAKPSGEEIETILGRVIAKAMPTIPGDLPESFRIELARLETLSDEDLKSIALSFVRGNELGKYKPGGESDLTMMRKAYANVLLRWRGESVSEEELERACHPI